MLRARARFENRTANDCDLRRLRITSIFHFDVRFNSSSSSRGRGDVVLYVAATLTQAASVGSMLTRSAIATSKPASLRIIRIGLVFYSRRDAFGVYS
jgi:hypothetical protein